MGREFLSFFFPSEKPPYFDTSNDTLWGPIWRFISSQNNNQSEVSPQHNTEKQPFKNLGHNWKLSQNPLTPPKGGGGGPFIGLLFLLWQRKMKPLAPAGSSRACIEAKINTAISEQDLSGVRFLSEVTEEQLHLSGEFNCEA